MPLFEFDCSQCGTVFEKLVLKAGATSEIVCPACGSRKVSEKLSAFAAVSRGGSPAAAGAPSCAPGGS